MDLEIQHPAPVARLQKDWRRLTVGGLVLLVASGCHEGPVRVRSFWATTIERMPVGSTYDWLSAANETTPSLADPDLHGFIQHNIECGLADLGYKRQPGGGEPDFFISYRSGTGIQPTSAGPTNMAMLAIEAHNHEGRLLWRGWAEGAVDPSTPPEVRRQRIERVVRRILSEFHPA